MKKTAPKFCGYTVIALSLALAISLLPIQATACYVVGDCRVTGGGEVTSGIDPDGGWDGTLAQGKYRSGSGQTNRYTFGGQAGANTAYPGPQGEWTHHQFAGPDGFFVFHGNVIDVIVCSDPGPCNPAAANGEYKQIDFGGWGRFNTYQDVNFEVQDAHWFEVHIEDLGEPGNKPRGIDLQSISCPSAGSVDIFAGIFGVLADCGCSDFYRIRIRANADPASAVVYEAYGYLTGGNFQIHQPTGFDMK
ncbi:MAG: hypothetical protein A4E65_02819 [Syntrophorhabdus sp. PtaU1.Bin153]|nr:MAG: hypothetical protein A4E65_02819 [Syntrophorhabdus sp. PtaU1.Bin153]